jgi:hypothetical protein
VENGHSGTPDSYKLSFPGDESRRKCSKTSIRLLQCDYHPNSAELRIDENVFATHPPIGDGGKSKADSKAVLGHED